jgi:hypothetical protein
METLSDEDLSAVHGQGSYTLKAGTVGLYTLDTADVGAHTVGPVPLSSVYAAINGWNSSLVSTVKSQSLTAANIALTPVTVALQAQFATIPVFGSTLSATFTPVKVVFSP